MTQISDTPLIIEVSLNGSVKPEQNPNVPYEDDDIVAQAVACMEAGAALVHNHTRDPVFGGTGVMDAEDLPSSVQIAAADAVDSGLGVLYPTPELRKELLTGLITKVCSLMPSDVHWTGKVAVEVALRHRALRCTCWGLVQSSLLVSHHVFCPLLI